MLMFRLPGTALPLLALAGLAACRGTPPAKPADLVVYGRVWTGDSARPWAGAVAVAGDTVQAVGDSAAIARLVASDPDLPATGSLLDAAEVTLIEAIERRFPGDVRTGAALLGTSAITFRRRVTSLPLAC